jgi:sugar lactone lactonase YvrE
VAKLYPRGFLKKLNGRYLLATLLSICGWLLSGVPLWAQVSFGNVTLGASSTQTVTFTFTSPDTLTGVEVLTQGTTGLDFTDAATGTCTATSYSAGQSCTVDVAFAPIAPGLRMGAVVLTDSSGPVMTTYISGIGIAPQLVFDAGVQSTVGTGLTLPVAAVPDARGNVYIGDGANLITVPADGGPQSTVDYGSTIQGLAIDGAGNLYFSTDTVQGVLEIPRGCTSASCTFEIVAGGLGSVAAGLAIDGAGAVYAAEYHDNQVVKIPQGCASSACVTVIADSTPALGGLNDPEGLAIDASGNLYIADTGGGRIVKIPPGCTSSTCQTILFSGPTTALTLDSAGNLYYISGLLQEIRFGANFATTILQLGGNSVAIDSSGSLYVADASTKQVYKVDYTSAPAFAFGSQPFETTSTLQIATLQNIGNADLTFHELTISPPAYAQQAISGADCSANLVLIPAALCHLEIVFTPSSIGAVAGSVTIKDNSLNNASAQQVIPLSGTGVQAATTVRLTSSANPAAIGGAVTFTANTAPITGTGTGVPGGVITFADNNVTIGTGTLSNGIATLTTNALALGDHFITATYAGDANFTGSKSSALNESITKALTTAVIASSANPAFFGAPITFTVTVSSSSPGTPTGIVSLMEGASTLGTGSLDGSGHASFTTNTGASPLSPGLHFISAVYTGDANFVGSATQPIVQTINQPTAISVTPASSTVTIASGQSATVPITLAGNGTFIAAGVVCRTQIISCQVQPTSTTVGVTPSTVTLTISALSVRASNVAPGFPFGEERNPSASARVLSKALTGGFASFVSFVSLVSRESTLALILGLPLMVFLRTPHRDECRMQRRTRRRKRTAALVIGLLLGVAAATSACGGGGSGGGGGGGNNGVPAGNYSVTVTVTGGSTPGSVVRDAVINVVVQ